MYNVLVISVMLAILISLGCALFFLVRDGGKTEHTVISLSIRVSLSILLLLLLAWGLIGKMIQPGA
jgi:Protein of unknown function (DUF2909)